MKPSYEMQMIVNAALHGPLPIQHERSDEVLKLLRAIASIEYDRDFGKRELQVRIQHLEADNAGLRLTCEKYQSGLRNGR